MACSKALIFGMESGQKGCQFYDLRPYTLALLAYTHVGVDRPGMAEALLVSTQSHLMMAECIAALGAAHAGGITACPPGRIGADMNTAMLEDSGRKMAKDMPGDAGGSDLTYLDSYWWGMHEAVWQPVFGEINQAMTDLSNLEQLNIHSDKLISRQTRVRNSLNRRAAATVCSMTSSGAPADLLKTLRMMFPGCAFEPTIEFVRELRVCHPEDM